MKELTARLEILSRSLEKPAKITLSLALSKLKSSPISNLIENLRENITPADVRTSFHQIMLVTNMGRSLIDIGKSFSPSDSSPLAMVGRYFILSGIPIS